MGAQSRHLSGRDAKATRGEILDAAEEAFARSGLAGARTDAIAARTGVTKAMIYYYYASKEALYQAVLERAFVNQISDIEQIVGSVQDPELALKEVLVSFLSRVEE